MRTLKQLEDKVPEGFRDDDWGLAVDLTSLMRDASEAQCQLVKLIFFEKKEDRAAALDSSKLRGLLRMLDQNMRLVRAHYERLGVFDQ